MNPVLLQQQAEADAAMRASGEAQPASAVPKLDLVRQDELTARETPLPPPIIDGILSRGEISLLSAGSKAGKSWMMLQAAMCIGAGLPFLGFPTTRGVAVYVNAEIAAAAWEERCRRMQEALGITAPQVWHVSARGQGLTMHNLVPALKDALAERRLSIVDALFLDPWYSLAAGVDENDAGDVGNVMRDLQCMTEELGGTSIVIAHHHTKGDAQKKEMLDRASGSGVFARAPDNILSLTEDSEGTALEVMRRNAKSPATLAVEFGFPVWRSLGERKPVKVRSGGGRRLLYTAERLVATFREPGEQLRRADFIARGIGRDAVGRCLEEAIAAGRIVREGDLYRLQSWEVEV